ncbi:MULTISPECIES: hypothetical protein [Mumia]|uniref:hypothetical protein n=1 Tax=Mumia TaxID=1546255 RepID=UPI00141E48E3|nr:MULTISPECIES: hypothetical protein [unclassified Mumia]QMW65010.1 hypothetical protein H4N58_12325 [Mumia sp. ZJ1417]
MHITAPSSERGPHTPWLLAVPLALILLLLTACGSSAGGSGVPSAGGSSSPTATSKESDDDKTDDEKALEFAACMRENGVPMEDPKPGEDGQGPKITLRSQKGSGPTQATVEKAMEECRALMPGDGKTRKPTEEELEQMRAFAACMREHGVDMSDPKADGGPMLQGFKDDEKTRKAMEACATLQPGARDEVEGSTA